VEYDTQEEYLGEFNTNKSFRNFITLILRIVNTRSGRVLKVNKVGRSIKQIRAYIEKNRLFRNYNETALAITPDDGPMRPKHAVE
jgi:curli biogenesis system outer membrane secretion channel CsgG